MGSVEAVGRTVLALGAVLVVMWLLARWAKRPHRRSDRNLDVLARQSLTRNSAVAVVRVAGRALVVGVTDAQVSLLGETDLAGFETAAAAAAAASPRARRGARRPLAPAGPAGQVPTAFPLALAPDSAGVPAAPTAVAPTAAAPTAAAPTGAASTAAAAALAARARARTARPGARRAGGHRSALEGSALSPATWRQSIEALRELTVRSGTGA